MGYRLSRIYTRTGDAGSTGLGDGSRTGKDSLRMEACGTVDELNSALGMLLANNLPEPLPQVLTAIQHDLFDLGGELSLPSGTSLVTDEDIDRLEQAIDSANQDLPPLKEFILPGGGHAAATCHLARTVCRRAERVVVALARTGLVHPPALKYLNRLSDLLFVYARVLARASGAGEVLWDNQHRRPR